MKNSIRWFGCTVALTVLLLSPLNLADAESKGKGSEKQSTMSATPANSTISVSTWISPSTVKKDENSNIEMIAVNPGSAISLKFRVFNGPSELNDSKNIGIIAVAASCLGMTPIPSPSATNIGNNVPGYAKKSAAPEIKYNKAGFNVLWKTSKLASGCFQFKVTSNSGGAVLLSSPTFRFSK